MKRKQLLYLLLILVVISLAVVIWLGLRSPLNSPESIAFDAIGKRFLISNVQGKSIVSMSLEGKFSKYLNTGLKAPRGLAIRDKALFIADQTNVIVVDLESAKITNTVPLPEAKMLNDLAFDKAGLLYVTDTAANCVFLVNPQAKTVEKIISPLLKAPNGIIYDMPRNQMFVVGYTKQAPILSLSTVDRSVRVFMDTIYSELDGIAIDDLGRIYVSTWAQKMIFEIPQEQNRFIAKYKDLKGAADILYYHPNNELIVPLLTQNRIIRIPLD